jgi:carboxymethylenebutenolidase
MRDGDSTATLHLPDGGGPWPAVLVFPDGGGAREVIRRMGDRLGGMGYVALVPDLYYRAGEWQPFDMKTAARDGAERARLLDMIGSLTSERIVADARAYLDFLLSRPEVSGPAVGTTGYCMGGRLSLITAESHPDRVAAAASFHGGRLAVADDPGSPHRSADRIRAAVYVAGATDDPSFTAEQAKLLETALAAAGVEYTLECYPARHGFAVPDHPAYDAVADDRHWRALDHLYRTHLPG